MNKWIYITRPKAHKCRSRKCINQKKLAVSLSRDLQRVGNVFENNGPHFLYSFYRYPITIKDSFKKYDPY